WSQHVRQNATKDHESQEKNRNEAELFHAFRGTAALPSSSAVELARSGTVVSIMGRMTSRSRSRASAAFQARCPMPGLSQSASTGIAAVNAMLAVTPATASSWGAATGTMCHRKTRERVKPLALADRTCGRDALRCSRLRAY